MTGPSLRLTREGNQIAMAVVQPDGRGLKLTLDHEIATQTRDWLDTYIVAIEDADVPSRAEAALAIKKAGRV